MSAEPDATSTPTSVPRLKGRKNIRDHNSIQSPIELETSHQYETRSYYRTLERSDELSPRQSPGHSPKSSPSGHSKQKVHEAHRSASHDSADSDSDQISEGADLFSDDSYKPHKQQIPDNADVRGIPQQKERQPILTKCNIGVIVAMVIVAGFLYWCVDDSSAKKQAQNVHQRIGSLENEFIKQQEDFWRNVKVAIQEISFLDQPRTIIFLYNNKAENTMKNILNKISNVALCHLSQCTYNPVIIEGASLNTSEIVNDYGKIISKYRDKLEKSGVMIVKNLEKVPGASAQAFHSFCDDYNPLVKNALILFTIKVEKMPEEYLMKFTEQFLLNLWSDIGRDDKFYPLFTRISGTILSVRPE